MAIDGLMFIAVILFIACIVAIVYNFALSRKDKKTGDRDTYVFNSMTQYTKSGSGIGKLKDIHQKDGWSAVEYFPRDPNLKKLEEEGRVLEPEVIFVPNNNLNWISKNAWLKDCGVLEIIPISTNDMPEGLKKSCIGLGMILQSGNKEYERFEGRMGVVKSKNIDSMIKDILDVAKIREPLLREGLEKKEEVNQNK